MKKTLEKIYTWLFFAFLNLVAFYLLFKIICVVYDLLDYRVIKGIFSLIVAVYVYYRFIDSQDNDDDDYEYEYEYDNESSSDKHCTGYEGLPCKYCTQIDYFNHECPNAYMLRCMCEDFQRQIALNRTQPENYKPKAGHLGHDVAELESDVDELEEFDVDELEFDVIDLKETWNGYDITKILICCIFCIFTAAILYILLHVMLVKIIIIAITSYILYELGRILFIKFILSDFYF